MLQKSHRSWHNEGTIPFGMEDDMRRVLDDHPARQGYRDVSVREFLDQARRFGWSFWRGFALGFISCTLIGLGALSGIPSSI